MKRLLFLTSILFFTCCLQAQDFQCNFSINSQKITGSSRDRFATLEQEIRKFINERKWCQYTLKMNERIKCNMIMNIESQSGDKYTGTMSVQLSRPVFKTNYDSPLLNFQDKTVEFTYAIGDPLEYVDNSNVSQLTSLIAFYLYLFLAVDFDSFSPNGGAPYIAKCQSIVNLCQTSAEKGWQMTETGRANRYWIVENFTNPAYLKVHDFLYTYHRLGLDVMSESPDAGRAMVLEALRSLQQVAQQSFGLYLLQIFAQTKSQEIVEIFKEGTPTEKSQVIAIMRTLDPSNASKYEVLNQASGR